MKSIVLLTFLGFFVVSAPASAANAQLFPPTNQAQCNGSASGSGASGRSVLTWDGTNDVVCRDLSRNASVLKSDNAGNIKSATAADVTPLVNVAACPSGQVLGGISNGTAVCVNASTVCTSLGGTWSGSACSMGTSLKQNTCVWQKVPGGDNGNTGTKISICPVGYYMAGYSNYREGDWTRTGHARIYCCQ